MPKGYFEWWGYRDSLLFEYAKEELQELASGDEPFNLTMLTVDTHFEDGFVCDLCGDEFGDNRYGNVIACSSRQVTEFVRWIQQQDFYENTTIVISGDHHSMDVDFCEDIDEDYVRRVYTAVINPGSGSGRYQCASGFYDLRYVSNDIGQYWSSNSGKPIRTWNKSLFG